MSARRAPPAWCQVDGVLLLDKPRGLSSNAALQRARRLYRAEKAGHSGTLDPLATGLLPCLFGEATKFGAELLDADKTYDAAIAFGETTTTGDAEGEVTERRPVAVTREEIERVLGRFRGRILQLPPMYSALKRDGRPLYAYARAGKSVPRSPRGVTIHELTLDAFEGDRLAVTVRCSKGTYVRVLAADIGRELGCGAHLAALRRSAVGRFSVVGAARLEILETLSSTALHACLRPIDALVGHLPALTLPADAAARFVNGQPVVVIAAEPIRFRVYHSDGVFLGLGERGPDGELRPRRLVRQGEKAPAARRVAQKIL